MKIFDKIIYKLIFKYSEKKIYNSFHKSSIIWHFSTPKSGSTFLNEYIQNSLESRKIVTPFPKIRNRQHEICIHTLFEKINSNLNNRFLTINIHSPHNNFLNKIFSKNHKIIIQYRNIFQTIESYVDFLDNLVVKNIDIKFPFFFIANNLWVKLSRYEKVQLFIDNYLPWHIHFIESWRNYSLNNQVILISYSEAIRQANEVTCKIRDKNELFNEKFTIDMNKVNYSKGFERNLTMNDIQKKNIRDFIDRNVLNKAKNYENYYFN